MAGPLARPLIVTAEFGPSDFAWLEGLRRRHFPAERNHVPAHLTIFHALPPSAEGEVRHALAQLSSEPPPRAFIAGTMNLSGGVAFRVTSEGLDRIRSELAEHFHGLLTAQDSTGWSAHVTIQNKVAPHEARALLEALGRQYDHRTVQCSGLALHRYLGGPWDTLQKYPFRG
jgi:hypothetical protein